MAKEIEMLETVWRELISSTLLTQLNYIEYSVDQINWLSVALYNIFIEEPIPAESTYKCLLFLNRSTKYGRYSLIFNKEVATTVATQKMAELKSICEKAEFPELKFLSESEQESWNKEIEIEILCLNLYTDREIICGEGKFNFSEKITSCFEEVCSHKLDHSAKYIPSYTGHTVFLSEMKNNKMFKYPMREIDMIFLILSKGVNPYTGEHVLPEVIDLLKIKYSDILLICKKAHHLGYRHTYKF